MRSLLVAMALLSFAYPVFACLNDGETTTHERQFRSQYLDKPTPPSSTSPGSESTNPPGFLAVAILGPALFLGALVITIRNVRSGS